MFRILSLTLLLLSSASAALHAQTLSLDKLVGLTHLPASLSPEHENAADLPGWVFQPATPLLQQEQLSWGWWPENTTVTPVPLAVLSLRPNHGLVDVVLHLSKPATLHSLRRELIRQKLNPQAVTCFKCSGERFTTATFSIALYQEKPEPYPYIVVIHRLETATPSKSVTTSNH
jgi:hypothetical protein